MDGFRSISKFSKASGFLRPHLLSPFTNLLTTDNPIIHSPSILPSFLLSRLIILILTLLTFIGFRVSLSVSDIGRINKPIVWTLHDMWAFCGAEHYTTDYRWRDGYLANNRPCYESGLDINRMTWLRKKKHFRRPLHIVCPSRWLAECVRDSRLLSHWPVSVIPNPIDICIWKPIDKKLARDLVG